MKGFVFMHMHRLLVDKMPVDKWTELRQMGLGVWGDNSTVVLHVRQSRTSLLGDYAELWGPVVHTKIVCVMRQVTKQKKQ